MKRVNYAKFEKVGLRATFIVILMLFNLVLPSLSGATVYAETGEAASNEEVASEVTAIEVINEDEDENDFITEEVAIDDEAVETAELQTETTEQPEEEPVTTPYDTETIAELNDAEEADSTEAHEMATDTVELEFRCWGRNGPASFFFTFESTTTSDSDVVEIEAGSLENNTLPDSYEDIVTERFRNGVFFHQLNTWDGEDFTWNIQGTDMEVSQANEECRNSKLVNTILGNDSTQIFGSALIGDEDDPAVCERLRTLLNSPKDKVTVFAPTDAAISAIPADDLAQLLGNPDELCALLGSHVVFGDLASTNITSTPTVVPAITNDVDGILLQLIGGNATADGNNIVEADIFANTGILHVVDGVLLPQSIGTIDPVLTNKTSPALSGTIELAAIEGEDAVYASKFCVLVRVNGAPYIADVSGSTWSIDEGVISINPVNQTQFDIVVRTNSEGGCIATSPVDDQVSLSRTQAATIERAGDALVGLTINNNVVSYDAPEEPTTEEETEENGEVLGTTDTVTIAAVATTPTLPVDTASSYSCGKGECGTVAQASDPSETDSDGDGVVDSEDPAPNDPNVTGLESDSQDDDNEDSQGSEDTSDSNVFWWFLVGGGATVGAYLFRQRSGDIS